MRAREVGHRFEPQRRGGRRDTAGKVLSPFSTDTRRLGFFGLGAGVMGLLTLLRYRLPWWPLHPIGFTVSRTYFTQKTVVAVFLAWACKLLILRLGGVTLYRRAQPTFPGAAGGLRDGCGAVRPGGYPLVSGAGALYPFGLGGTG